jgi:hypothetical protein
LFLHPERAEEFANAAMNPYNDFVCHKTGVILEDSDYDDRGGDIVRGEKSLTCMGFASLQHNLNDHDENFVPDPHAFDDDAEMISHHEDEYYKTRK